MEKLFEKAIRGKFRFNHKGLISTEDLWDISLKDLDFIFKDLKSKIKKEEEESLFEKFSLAEDETREKIEIVKYIASKRIEEKEAQQNKIKKQQEKKKIMELIEMKQEQGLMNKSEEELKELLKSLD